MIKGKAVDENGKFCGMNNFTGEMTILDPKCVGYCGPDCNHCVSSPVYILHEGTWVCAADYEIDKD